jgi:hypothetical protein
MKSHTVVPQRQDHGQSRQRHSGGRLEEPHSHSRLNGLRVHLILGGSELQHGAERSSPLRMLRIRAPMKRLVCLLHSNFRLPVLIRHFPKVMNRGLWKPQLLHRRFLSKAFSLALLDGGHLA